MSPLIAYLLGLATTLLLLLVAAGIVNTIEWIARWRRARWESRPRPDSWAPRIEVLDVPLEQGRL